MHSSHGTCWGQRSPGAGATAGAAMPVGFCMVDQGRQYCIVLTQVGLMPGGSTIWKRRLPVEGSVKWAHEPGFVEGLVMLTWKLCRPLLRVASQPVATMSPRSRHWTAPELPIPSRALRCRGRLDVHLTGSHLTVTHKRVHQAHAQLARTTPSCNTCMQCVCALPSNLDTLLSHRLRGVPDPPNPRHDVI